MPTATDPKWKQRRWQGYHESQQDYIKYLLTDIADCKELLKNYDELAAKRVEISDEFLTVIATEKAILQEYQEELRRVVQG